MPAHLPAPCKDLIRNMLVVDPLKRISIAQIRQHEWFQTALPAYLRLSPEETLLKNADMHWDEALLQFVAQKLDVPEDIARRALLNGTKNDISVAYFILLDNRRLRGSRPPSSPLVESPVIPMTPPPHDNHQPHLVPSPMMESLMTSTHGPMEKQVLEKK